MLHRYAAARGGDCCLRRRARRGRRRRPRRRLPLRATDIQVVIKDGGERRLAVAVPAALRSRASAALQSKVADPFTATLRSDLDYAGAFSVTDPAHYPSGFRDPTTPEAADRWLGTGAEVLVDTRGDVAGRPRLRRGARLGPEVAQADPRPPVLGRRLLRRAHRAHARQRPRQVLHRARTASFSRRSSSSSEQRGRRQGDLRDGFRRPQPAPADVAQVDRDLTPTRRGGQDRLHLATSTSFPRSGSMSARRERQEGDPDRRRAERLARRCRPTAARSPSPARRRATPTSTRSPPDGGTAHRLTTTPRPRGLARTGRRRAARSSTPRT